MEKLNALEKEVSIVYLAAGISSRFGGKVKQFEKVGPNGETLIEVSMNHAVSAGVSEIIFIVGDKTELIFKEKFGDDYKGTPVKYAKQFFNPDARDRPWGTADALISAKNVIKNSFLICNGDDLYGENSFKRMKDFMSKSKDDFLCASAGYELGNVIPAIGEVNRAVYSLDNQGYISGLDERFNIEKNSLEKQGLNSKTLVSMNLFGLTLKTIELLEENLVNFKKSHLGDRKIECFLPVELSNLIKENKIKMKLLPTSDKWLGITNPGDELTVRNALAKK
ncbi:MAG: sugar phosphate nucleotidyltransferase [archaeon]